MKKECTFITMTIIFCSILLITTQKSYAYSYSLLQTQDFFASAPFQYEIASTFNPLGSGARAMGRGGACIAACDDCTAINWNPGLLIKLIKPEFSFVYNNKINVESISFGAYPESGGTNSTTDDNIHFMSFSYPFRLGGYNWVISFSYQELFDFDRAWNFTINKTSYLEKIDYVQTGSLSALSVAYCMQLLSNLSFGMSFNIWDNDLTKNKWRQHYHNTLHSKTSIFSNNYEKVEEYEFSGWNVNIGALCQYHDWSVGVLLKTPFKANIQHSISTTSLDQFGPEINQSKNTYFFNEELKMPLSYGLGVSYAIQNNFFVSADVYKTHWNNFVLIDEGGNEISPITGKSLSKTNTKPTHQVRLGMEYHYIDQIRELIIPLRCGLFYDPAPAANNPDDFYGLTFGFGLSKDFFSVDFAYQFRFANNVGTFIHESWDFSQDIREHNIYMSMILYWK